MKLENIANKHFKSIKEIGISDIPAEAMEHFENLSRRFILPSTYKKGDFEQFFMIHYDNPDITYVATQTRTYEGEGGTERLTYLFDVDTNGNKQGHGEIRFSISSTHTYFKDKPFAGYLHNSPEFIGKDLGIRRLHVMNELSQLFYGFKMHTDTVISDSVMPLLEELTNQSILKKYKEGKHDRYVFK